MTMSPAVTHGATLRFSENGLAGFDGRAARVAFNRAAESIESTARDNPVNSWMREASRRAILRAFPEECALVEIGCGAGADAVYLAEHGYRVAAIDVSDRMVELARQRSVDRNVSHAVQTFRGRLTEVAPELRGLGWAPYMGAYANFSLTYEAALRRSSPALSR
jgi:SAM-dependent methyltransferase